MQRLKLFFSLAHLLSLLAQALLQFRFLSIKIIWLILFVFMKREQILIISLAFFSLITGYLLSAISFVGRAGISLFYTEYQFLKTWWKGALLVFFVWMLLFLIQSYLFKKVSKKSSNIIQTVLMMIAVTGLFFTYSDFRNTLSHRWLGERFHLGAYLFWLGWIAITIFVSLQKRPIREVPLTSETEEIPWV